MVLIQESDQKYLREEFSKSLKSNIELIVFTAEDGQCKYCKETVQLAEEVSSLTGKIKLTIYDFNKDAEKARELGVDKYPTTIVCREGSIHGRVRYAGIPSGYEFGSLIEDIKMVSDSEVKISSKAMEIISKVKNPVRIKVFVTPTCPYCPRAVETAHKFAFTNEKVSAEMIETSEFNKEAQDAGVTAVPHIVINDDIKFDGARPDEEFAEYVLEASMNSAQN
ncbi:MAG: thioredoxin family protein [Candidatus Thermoplasmatota archaeon]|nr:thioredoxin family protein [Candidatus Thermoplasmatota archaeon]